MKKLSYLIAVAVMFFGLIGCGGGGGNYNAGDLIEEFGNDGIVEYGDPSKKLLIFGSTIDDEDNIYVAGYLANGSNKAFIYKFDKDGNIVLTKEIKESNQHYLHYYCIIFYNNSLYVGGETVITPNHQKAILVKYDKNLNLDTNFGINGYVLSDSKVFKSLAIANNKIYVGGEEIGGNHRAVMYRVFMNGNFDINYQSLGINQSSVHNIIPLDNEKVYIGLYEILKKVYILKYRRDGIVDGNFNMITINFLSFFYDFKMRNNEFYVAGMTSALDAKVVKIKSNGVIDLTFGSNGTIGIDEGSWCSADSLSFDSDDNLYVSYSIYENSIVRFKLIKYDINGDIDTSFANNGKVEISNFNPVNSHIDSDGNLIIVGNKKVGSYQYIIKLAKIHL
jgi:hypothetical protein